MSFFSQKVTTHVSNGFTREKELVVAPSEFSPPHRHDHLTMPVSTKAPKEEPWRAPISKIALLLPQT